MKEVGGRIDRLRPRTEKEVLRKGLVVVGLVQYREYVPEQSWDIKAKTR